MKSPHQGPTDSEFVTLDCYRASLETQVTPHLQIPRMADISGSENADHRAITATGLALWRARIRFTRADLVCRVMESVGYPHGQTLLINPILGTKPSL